MTGEPFTETFPLQDGGDLTLTQFQGEPHVRLAYDKNGTRVSLPLAPADVKNLREATGALCLFHLTEAGR